MLPVTVIEQIIQTVLRTEAGTVVHRDAEVLFDHRHKHPHQALLAVCLTEGEEQVVAEPQSVEPGSVFSRYLLTVALHEPLPHLPDARIARQQGPGHISGQEREDSVVAQRLADDGFRHLELLVVKEPHVEAQHLCVARPHEHPVISGLPYLIAGDGEDKRPAPHPLHPFIRAADMVQAHHPVVVEGELIVVGESHGAVNREYGFNVAFAVADSVVSQWFRKNQSESCHHHKNFGK